MTAPIRLATLISGGGTTLQNLIDRIAMRSLDAEIAGVISSRANAFGIERANRAGLPVVVVEKPSRSANGAKDGGSGPAFAEQIWKAVRSFEVDLVCLAGWMHLLPIPENFRHKVLNIHPSLLPAFGGKGMYGHRVHEAVIAYGAKVSGCTVHFADDTYDTGPILVQKCVSVKEGDDPDTLAARVFQAECEAYPEAIQMIASGRITVQGRRVIVT